MNKELRNKYFKRIGEAIQDYGFSPIMGWIEALLSIEKRGLTQKEISETLTEVLSHEDSATSLPSVNRALKIMEANQMITKKGSRKKGYKYFLNLLSGIPTGFFKKVLTVNKENLQHLLVLKEEIEKSDDKDLTKGINIEIMFSQTLVDFSSEFLERLKKISEEGENV
jgi:DNA-binding transcriptional regulator GbsR (MarR family)